ncbi:hypothetical protein SUGI_0990930 [Cryptomeria japonica]|nr:hypothetical protein SUGI_0990930 [Cryptomeria japonica]
MDAVYGGDSTARSPAMEWKDKTSRQFQHYLDKSTPHPVFRWILLAAVAGLFSFRIYYVKGFYIVAYTVGIYVINLLIGFLSPQVDPEIEGAALPTKGSDEFKPFIRRLPEFKFWYALMKAFLIAFVLTFFSIFDLPVFWPILLLYWLVNSATKERKHLLQIHSTQKIRIDIFLSATCYHFCELKYTSI